jgi:uncharacterized MnhB-related membrane protein
MFVGHYGPAYAANVARRTIPLWVLFIAVQLLDVWWAIFVLLGIEKVRIVPGITATSPFDLYYMPYTHSLIGSVIWSIGAGLLYYLFRTRDGRIAAAIVGAAVFSHWVLDLLVHRPDLSMYDDTLKVGLGLWNYPIPAILLELAVLFGGIFLYLRTTRAITPFGRYGMVIFGVAMAIIQSIAFFGPPPASVKANAVTTLALYAIFTGAVWWLEKQRIPAVAT